MNNLVLTLLEDAPAFAKQAGRPLVTLSYAQSLDGSLAVRRGQSTAISGPESTKMTHRLRAAHDAILVGIGTVRADDPQLTVRGVEGRSPQVVVLDSKLSFPLNAKLLQLGTKPWIFCAPSSSKEAQTAIEEKGARVFRVGALGDERVDLLSVLKQLVDLDIKSLMVEGGAAVIASFLKSGFTDQVALTIAPIFIGGLKVLDGVPDIVKRGIFPRVEDPQMERLGDDYVLWGKMLRDGK